MFGKCLLERTLVMDHQLCEVGWPVSSLPAFISPVFPSGPHSLLDGQRASNPWFEVCLEPWIFGTVCKRSSRYATGPSKTYMFQAISSPKTIYIYLYALLLKGAMEKLSCAWVLWINGSLNPAWSCVISWQICQKHLWTVLEDVKILLRSTLSINLFVSKCIMCCHYLASQVV